MEQAMMMWPEPKKPGRRKWKSSTPGFIYFAKEKFQRFGPIKIGWATDPARRVADLQMGNPRKLIILGTTPGTPALERLIHRHFADDRGSGEWFRQSPDLVALAEGRLTIDPASIAEATKAA